MEIGISKRLLQVLYVFHIYLFILLNNTLKVGINCPHFLNKEIWSQGVQ